MRHLLSFLSGLLFVVVPLSAGVSYTILDDQNPFYSYGNGPNQVPHYTTANAISNNGTVFGRACCGFQETTGIDFYFNNGTNTCMYYSALPYCVTTPFQNLGTLPFDSSSTPYSFPFNSAGLAAGVNNLGVYIGNISDQFSDSHGFVTLAPFYDTNLLDYPGLQVGYGYTTLTGINDSNQITGYWVSYLDGSSGGFLYQNGIFTNLSYTPYGINDRGQIVGVDANQNVIIDTGGAIRNLGMLPFTPSGINDSDIIVGGDYLYAGGQLTPITLPGIGPVTINGINDSNTFVGNFSNSQGTFGFVATPEPAFLIPLGIGIAALAAWRRGHISGGHLRKDMNVE